MLIPLPLTIARCAYSYTYPLGVAIRTHNTKRARTRMNARANTQWPYITEFILLTLPALTGA